MVSSKNVVFNAKKYNFPLFSGENELAHDNKRVSNYKIMQKSQIRKFRFSGTLRWANSIPNCQYPHACVYVYEVLLGSAIFRPLSYFAEEILVSSYY